MECIQQADEEKSELIMRLQNINSELLEYKEETAEKEKEIVIKAFLILFYFLFFIFYHFTKKNKSFSFLLFFLRF